MAWVSTDFMSFMNLGSHKMRGSRSWRMGLPLLLLCVAAAAGWVGHGYTASPETRDEGRKGGLRSSHRGLYLPSIESAAISIKGQVVMRLRGAGTTKAKRVREVAGGEAGGKVQGKKTHSAGWDVVQGADDGEERGRKEDGNKGMKVKRSKGNDSHGSGSSSEEEDEDVKASGPVSDSYKTSDEDEEDSEDRFARSYMKELKLDRADMSFVDGGDQASKAAVKDSEKEKMMRGKKAVVGDSEDSHDSEDEEAEEVSVDGADKDDADEAESLREKRERKKKKRKKGADYWLEDAEKGDVAAQYEVAMCYASGRGCDEDQGRAFFWFNKAANQGHPEAQAETAWRYSDGKGCKSDQLKATDWFRKSCDQGYPQAMFVLGWRMINGVGLDVDEPKGIELYMKAAARGVPEAQCNLALRFEEGRGVPKDEEKALKYYNQASENGSSEGQLALGMRLAQGTCGASVDAARGFELVMESAKSGHAEAQHAVGVVLDDGLWGQERNPKKAVAWYRKAASKGYAPSQFNLGMCWFHGQGVDAQDAKKGIEWFQKAADSGSADAMHNLAICYRKGVGLDKDETLARKWDEKAKFAGFVLPEDDVGMTMVDGPSKVSDKEENYQHATSENDGKEGRNGQERQGSFTPFKERRQKNDKVRRKGTR